jgi:hypothetical protein
MKNLKTFNRFINESNLNEAASWGVNVEEPFNDKAERKSQDKFVMKTDPIKVAGSSGFISEDKTEVFVQLTNGDEIYYNWTQQLGNSAEMSITIERKEYPISQKTLDDYLGSTGTVIGDMLLVYKDWKTGKIK